MRLGLILAITILSSLANTQDNLQLPQWLTSAERKAIEKEDKGKDQVEVLMEIASARLAMARNNIASQQYEQAHSEIKNNGALVAYTFSYIDALPKKDKEKQGIYKLFELKLRPNINNLESMRYELPEKYTDEANKVYEQVRKVREAALAKVFGKEFFQPKEGAQEQSPPSNNSQEE
ncbi:MAG: hypothetical protein AB1489_26510 [Acidobacteriota bacterium]